MFPTDCARKLADFRKSNAMGVSSLRRAVASLLVTIALMLACNDKGNDSRELGSAMISTAEVLDNAQAEFIEPYMEILRSFELLRPNIEAVLRGVTGPESIENSASCLPEDVGGWEYAFSGTTYEKLEPPYIPDIIPESVVIFRLYELDNGNTPKLNRINGYLEIFCDSDSPQTRAVRVLNQNMEAIQIVTYTAGDNLISGGYVNTSSNDTLLLGGELRANGADAFNYSMNTLTVRAIYPVPWGSNKLSSVTINSLPYDSWGIVVEIEVDSADRVQQGHVYWADPMENPMLAGCITEGTLESPEIDSPSDGCQTGINIYQTSTSERTAIKEVYQTMRLFWTRDHQLAVLCRSL